jgi:outer membrane autotransporter protein
MKQYFKLNERLKKIFNYFSIFTIILGSTFGTMNTANAATVVLSSPTTEAAGDDGDDYQLTDDESTVLGAADIYSSLTNKTGTAVAATFDISGDTLTITNDITSIANSSIAVTVSTGDGLTITGSTIENATASAVTIALEADSVLTLDAAGTEAMAAAIDGTGAGLGILNTTKSGIITFSDTVGTTNGLAAINIGTATDDSGVVFAEAVKATTITVLSGESTGENSSAKFAKAVTGNIVMTDGAHAASHATVTFNGTTALTALSGTITTTKTDADDTFVIVEDSAAGTAAAQTFSGQIGTSTNKIASIAVGVADSRAGAAVFSSDVFVNAVTISSDDDTTGGAEISSMTVNGNLTATTIVLDKDTNDAKLIVAGTSTTVAGTIDGAGDAEGILQVTGAGTTISGEVGLGTTSLSSIDVDATTTFSDATEAAAYTVDADSTFTGAVLANTSFTVDTSAAVTLTAASDLSLATVTTGTLTANGLLTTSDLINTAGKVYLNAASNEMGAGRYAAGDGAELHVGKAFVSGNTIIISDDAAGVADYHTGSKIYLPTNLSGGETLKIVDDGQFDVDTTTTALTMATRIDSTLQDTALVDYSASAAGASVDTVTITATNKTVATIASELTTTSNDATAALQLMDALDANDVSGDTAAYTAFDNALKAQNGLTATDDTNLIKQTSPQTDLISGSSVAAQAVTGSVQGIMSNRMASLRSGDAFYGSGMSAGSLVGANSAFLQVFGSTVEQGNTTVGSGTQFGYNADTSGIAFGTDYVTDTGSVVGLSLSASETEVDGNGTGNSENNIDSYTASIYVDKSTDTGYVEGSLTIGRNENTTSRIVNTAGLDRTYTGSYDSNQASLKIGAGKANAVGTGYVTPFGSVTHTKISIDAYTETSTTANDSLRLRVAQDDVNSTVGTVGLKYHNILDNGGSPMISLAINKEFGDETINSTNTYQGGGTAFTTSTDVEDMSATLGLGYSYNSDSGSIEFAYEADANDDDYLSHYGSIKFNKKF